MTEYVLNQHELVSGTDVEIYNCETCLLLIGPDAPGKIAAHLIQYENLEIEDTVMVMPHIPGQNAEDVLCRLGEDRNEFRPSMSEEMAVKRNQFLRDIEGPMDA